jgi:hypothetical protein
VALVQIGNTPGRLPLSIIEHPTLEGLGFILLLAGFLIQLLSIPSPTTKTGDEADQETGKASKTPLARCGLKLARYPIKRALARTICYSYYALNCLVVSLFCVLKPGCLHLTSFL